MYEQLYEYLNNYLYDLLCGFHKAYSTQYVLSRLITSLEKGLDNSGLVVTILMDLTKAYNSLPHDHLIVKLERYGLDKPNLNLINGYLCFRKQKKKIGTSGNSDWANVTRVIPQRPILGPLLFNIFINDIFLFIEKSDKCKFVDDKTLFSCRGNLSVILKSLEHDTKILFTYSES